jgi:hypothetical protein
MATVLQQDVWSLTGRQLGKMVSDVNTQLEGPLRRAGVLDFISNSRRSSTAS